MNSRTQYEIENNINFYNLVFTDLDNYDRFWIMHILIAFRKTGLTLRHLKKEARIQPKKYLYPYKKKLSYKEYWRKNDQE